MSLIYRAIWRDDRTGLTEAAHDSFQSWVESKHAGLEVAVGGVSETTNADERVSCGLKIVEGPTVSALEGVLTEERGSERWMTRLRVLAGEAGEQWIWVDLERVAEDFFRTQSVAAPRLVRQLLDDGAQADGNPRVGPMRLGTKAYAVPPDRVRESVIDLLEDEARTTPIVVFSHDEAITPKDTMDRAQACANILAGVATVLALPPATQVEFERLVGQDLSVWGGAARLYLPGELAPNRHRYIRRDILQRHPREGGQRFAQMLSGFISARRAPAIYEEARPLLRERAGASVDELLAVAESEVQDRNAQLDSLRAELETERDERLNAFAEVEELQQEVLRQRIWIRDLQRQLSGGTGDGDSSWEVPDHVTSLEEAARLCRVHLRHVELAEGACRDLDELDSTIEGEAWAQTAWNGLRALDAYARGSADFNGGFWEWCKRGGHVDSWPATSKKLAMSESETVMANDRLRTCRVLPVATSVDAGGTVVMEAHLKIAEGGGGNAPRIYFYDDTGGSTRKIHIGFFGPHRYMPNTKTN